MTIETAKGSRAAREPQTMPCPPAPALVYVATDGTVSQIDAASWDPALLSARDRVLCIALLEYSLQRIQEAE